MAGDWGRETETHVQYCKSFQEAAAAPFFVALFCSFSDFVYLLVGSFLNLGACGVPGMSSGTFSFLIFLQKGVSLSLTLLPFKDCCVSWLLFFSSFFPSFLTAAHAVLNIQSKCHTQRAVGAALALLRFLMSAWINQVAISRETKKRIRFCVPKLHLQNYHHHFSCLVQRLIHH